eukprot:INCI9215.3.p1 GENE.INCI9215.3~~INCI9215.3.p1  ORF type:complete len:769 (+),score=144.84 INCI9215.3:271-2577(+)
MAMSLTWLGKALCVCLFVLVMSANDAHSAPSDSTLPPTSTQKPAPTVLWYRVSVHSEPIGYMYTMWEEEEQEEEEAEVGTTETTSSNNCGIRYTEEMNFGVLRGSDTVAMFALTSSVESMDGRLFDMSVVQKTAETSVKSSFAFNGTGFFVLSSGGSFDGGASKFVPILKQNRRFLSRVAAQKDFEQACRAGAQRHVVATVRPELGAAIVNVTRERTDFSGSAIAADFAALVATSRWKTSLQGVPLTIYESYTADCTTLVRSEMQSPFGPLVVELASEEAVQPLLRKFKAKDFSDSKFPEIVNSASVPLAFPLVTVQTATIATFRVELEQQRNLEEDRGLFLPSAGYQTFSSELVHQHSQHPAAGNNKSRVGFVTVDLSRPQPVLETVDLHLADSEYLAASTMINSNDAGVRDLHATLLMAAGKPATPGFSAAANNVSFQERWARAGVFREGVRRYITRKDLNTGYGSASEVVISRAGDCTEHAVLLAALLRVDGIPARVCNGLVYTEHWNTHGGAWVNRSVDPAFGWHMWTQAAIAGHWLDLDATLPQPFNVGHILVSTESLSGGSVISGSILAMLPLMKHLRIELQSIEGVHPRKPANDLAPDVQEVQVGVLHAALDSRSKTSASRTCQRARPGDKVHIRASTFLRRSGAVLSHSTWNELSRRESPQPTDGDALLETNQRAVDVVQLGPPSSDLRTKGGMRIPAVVAESAIAGLCAGERRVVMVPNSLDPGNPWSRSLYVHKEATIVHDIEIVDVVTATADGKDEL